MPQRPTLLIVEDEPFLRDLLTRVLTPHYELLLAGDGKEAVAHFQQHGPQLAGILTDLNMPHMNGPAFLAWLAEQPWAVPVLVVSSGGNAMLAAARQAFPLPMAWLPKPFLLEELRAAVADLVSHPSGLQESPREAARGAGAASG